MRQRLTYPENQLRISSVPAVADIMSEETPGESVILLRHQYPDSVLAKRSGHVLFPNHRQEQWASRVHHCDIWQEPMLIVCLKRIDDFQEERMLRNRTHSVVRDSGRLRSANPCWVRKKGIETALAALYQSVSGILRS